MEKRIKALEENGTGGITNETDPTVPQWAKEPTKPSYTAEEVGAPTKEEFEKLSEDIASVLNIDILDNNWSTYIGGVTDYPTRIRVNIDNVKERTEVTFGKLVNLTYGNSYYWRCTEYNGFGEELNSQKEWVENTVDSKYVVQRDCNLVLEFRYPSSSVDVTEESTWQPIKSALKISYSKNISDIVDLIDLVAVNVTEYVDLPYDFNGGYRWNGSAELTAIANYDAISIPVTGVKTVEITGSLSSTTRNFYMYTDGTNSEMEIHGDYSSSEPLILDIPDKCNELRLTVSNKSSFAFSIKNMGDKFTYKACKQSDMDNVMLRIGKLEGEFSQIASDEMPEYWTEQIENKVSEINAIINNASADYNNISVFFTQADPHYPSNTGMATVLMRELSKRCGISLLLNLGDLIQDSTTSHAENLKRIQEAMDRMIKGTDILFRNLTPQNVGFFFFGKEV